MTDRFRVIDGDEQPKRKGKELARCPVCGGADRIPGERGGYMEGGKIRQAQKVKYCAQCFLNGRLIEVGYS